jgi:hypothetical protein
MDSSSSSSISDNLDNIHSLPLQYNLAMQNKRNKSYQHSSQVYFKTFSVAEKPTARENSKNKNEMNRSFNRNELFQSQNKPRLHKECSPNKINSKKRKKQ